MEITSSGISVYEVVLDLKQWEGRLSNEFPGFMGALVELLPSTVKHKCMSGQEGGFHAELASGTNFGHVVEHVLLELIHLSDPHGTEFSGWTKHLGDGKYVIHYGAPGFLAGRLAAILAVEIVGQLLHDQKPDLDLYIEQMKDPLGYFTQRRTQDQPAEHTPLIDLMEGLDPESEVVSREMAPTLSEMQSDNLVKTLANIEDRMPEISRHWEKAFVTFGGDFARGILDKIELINPDKYTSCFAKGDFRSFFQGVSNLSRMMRSLRIPLNFVTHSTWLYKNFMQLVIMEKYVADVEAQTATIWDFDDFYQNVFHAILQGYSQPLEAPAGDTEFTFCGFRARHARLGKVLVVDDDTMARKVARNILEYRGIPTIGARDGVEALSILAEEGAAVGVVLLDVVMPGMAGQAVCRRIRDSHPRVRVILNSGFPQDGEIGKCLEDHEVSFLQKPYSGSALVSMVADLMDLWVTGNGQQEWAG